MLKMNDQLARKILDDCIQPDDSLSGLPGGWNPDDIEITLDGSFTQEQMEAIAWWMKNKRRP